LLIEETVKEDKKRTQTAKKDIPKVSRSSDSRGKGMEANKRAAFIKNRRMINEIFTFSTNARIFSWHSNKGAKTVVSQTCFVT
jgi:hypothetical protein